MTSKTAEKPHITEKDFLAQVRQLAKLLGWEVYHPFLSKWSERGFPDLTLIKDCGETARLVFAELKTEKGKLTEDQMKWQVMLAKVEGIEVYVWRPSDFDNIAKILRSKVEERME